jgi:hypothetical protein
MANALPQAIGAQMEFPKRQVVTFSGDGGIETVDFGRDHGLKFQIED